MRVVRGLLEKEDLQTRDDLIRREWKMLAETVDRCRFYISRNFTTNTIFKYLYERSSIPRTGSVGTAPYCSEMSVVK